ncbi:hypothetical protein ISCGN_029181 [Ixodes scapularis]
MFLLAVACTLMPFTEGSGWPDRNCGRSLVRSRDRFILDGRPAKHGEFPWMVYLLISLANGKIVACGGSIIKRDVVLTAAHCLPVGFNTNATTLFAGRLYRTFVGEYYQARKIKQVITHEDYWGDVVGDHSHDIALAKLTRPFDLEDSNGRIGTVCLAVVPPRPGNVVTVAGWGRNSLNGTGTPKLLAVTIRVIRDDVCSKKYSFWYRPKIMFCAAENRKQPAMGDSGCPAVVTSARKSLQDSRLREAGAEAVYCLTPGDPKGPNLPRARLNHQDARLRGQRKATHSQTWAGEPAWLGVRGDATHQTPAFTGAPCEE